MRACLAVASHMHAQKTGRPVLAVLGGWYLISHVKTAADHDDEDFSGKVR